MDSLQRQREIVKYLFRLIASDLIWLEDCLIKVLTAFEFFSDVERRFKARNRPRCGLAVWLQRFSCSQLFCLMSSSQRACIWFIAQFIASKSLSSSAELFVLWVHISLWSFTFHSAPWFESSELHRLCKIESKNVFHLTSNWIHWHIRLCSAPNSVENVMSRCIAFIIVAAALAKPNSCTLNSLRLFLRPEKRPERAFHRRRGIFITSNQCAT
jgi:hypothetical protein